MLSLNHQFQEEQPFFPDQLKPLGGQGNLQEIFQFSSLWKKPGENHVLGNKGFPGTAARA